MTLTRIKWTSNALQDLDRVRAYLAESAGEDIVLSEAQRIWDGCQRLKEFPESGRPGRVPMTREVLVSPYIIPYRIKDDCVEILNIFNFAQKR